MRKLLDDELSHVMLIKHYYCKVYRNRNERIIVKSDNSYPDYDEGCQETKNFKNQTNNSNFKHDNKPVQLLVLDNNNRFFSDYVLYYDSEYPGVGAFKQLRDIGNSLLYTPFEKLRSC